MSAATNGTNDTNAAKATNSTNATNSTLGRTPDHIERIRAARKRAVAAAADGLPISGIANSLGDFLEEILVTAKPYATPEGPKGTIYLEPGDRANLASALARVLYGDLAMTAAERILAGFGCALAQILLDQDPIA